MRIATKDNISILFELAFIDQEAWSGGKARSVQLLEILQDAGFRITEADRPVRPGKFGLLRWAIAGILKFGIYRPFTLDSLRTTGFNYFRYSWYASKYPDAKTYLLEGTGFGQVQSVRILRSFGKRTILVPANVESLVKYDSWTHEKGLLYAFTEELQYLKEADSIFCISEEETWIIRVMGCNGYFLPYFPPRQSMELIARRKQARLTSAKKGLFYFASFHNAPNILGLKNFINERGFEGKKIRIAGMGIEKVKPLLDKHPEFEVLGELNADQLEKELISCEAVVINHFPTAGMLTRVPDLLLSGIPIQGNIDALKSYVLISPDVDPGEHLAGLTRKANQVFIGKLTGDA